MGQSVSEVSVTMRNGDSTYPPYSYRVSLSDISLATYSYSVVLSDTVLQNSSCGMSFRTSGGLQCSHSKRKSARVNVSLGLREIFYVIISKYVTSIYRE